MNISEFWCVEYCSRQEQFHVEKLEEIIKTNQRYFLEKRPLEWTIVGIAISNDDACKLLDLLKKSLA